MFSFNTYSDNYAVPVPLQRAALNTAAHFAMEQPNQTKARQVYRNTLAVCAVQQYFGLLGIETDAPHSDGWHQSLRLAGNVADLILPERGVIECLPISSDTDAVMVAEEVQIRRIAYLVVEIEEPFQMAMLLGFSKSTGLGQSSITRTDLISPNELPIYLAQFHHTSLKAWYRRDIAPIWQPPDRVLATSYSAFRFRNRVGSIIKQARVLELTSAMDTPIHLGLLLSTKNNGETVDVSVQLHPAKGELNSIDTKPSLHPGITLELLSDEGEVLQTVVSRHNPLDTFIQLVPFRCLPYDYYQVRVILGSSKHTEIVTS